MRVLTNFKNSRTEFAKFRYNNLLKIMRKDLPLLRKALKGLVGMSSELKAMGTAMFANQVLQFFFFNCTMLTTVLNKGFNRY